MTGDVRPVLVRLLTQHADCLRFGVEWRCTVSGQAVADPTHPLVYADMIRAHQADVIASAGVVVATSEVETLLAETVHQCRRHLDLRSAHSTVNAFEWCATRLRALVAGARGGAQ